MTTSVYVSHPDKDGAMKLAIALNRLPDHSVFTNFDFTYIADEDAKSDRHTEAICDSDLFVFVASDEGQRKLPRAYGLGIAIGAGTPVAFIGTPRNPLHRYGDVFSDTASFIEAWSERSKADPDLCPVYYLPGAS